jgi:hypothetical protein
MKEDLIDYDTDIEVLLKANAEECESLSLLHRLSYEKFNNLSNIINVPVIVLSSAIGFATGIEIGYDKINIVLGVASIFVGIIKSIDSYFGLPKRAEGHRICSLQYAQFNKRLAVELALRREQRQNPKDMLNLIKTDMKNLADIAPLIDEDIILKFRGKYADDGGHYATHTANITNGLTPIMVNGKNITEEVPKETEKKENIIITRNITENDPKGVVSSVVVEIPEEGLAM